MDYFRAEDLKERIEKLRKAATEGTIHDVFQVEVLKILEELTDHVFETHRLADDAYDMAQELGQNSPGE